MSASEGAALDAIAFQMLGALEEYEGAVDQLVHTWMDVELYRRVGGRIEDLRRFASGLPDLSVPSVALSIAHAELMCSLWHAKGGEGKDTLAQVHERHRACVARLSFLCCRLLAQPTGAHEERSSSEGMLPSRGPLPPCT